MKILFLSSLYSSTRFPKNGVVNTRILKAMREHATIRVIAPIPLYPWTPSTDGQPSSVGAQVPYEETDADGTTVLHPRTLHIPGFGRRLYAGLYGASVFSTVRTQVRQFQPDVLLSAWAYPDGTATVALGRLLGVPTVVRVMGSDINDYAQRPGRRQQISWAMRHADGIIAVSQALGTAVRNLGALEERVSVIPNGVDATKFFPVDRAAARRTLNLGDSRVIVVASRLSREKGLHYFLDALSRLPSDVRAVLVGDGPEKAALQTQAKRLQLADRVEFAGFKTEESMRLYYSAGDVSCLASTEEGWPNALMESFACGCPIAATDVGGVSELLALTGAGMLARPGDADDLARALRTALETPFNRADIAAQMAQHTLTRSARRYVDACRAVQRAK